MKEFHHKSSIKPKIFGMRASLVIRKDVASVEDCECQLSEREVFVPSTREINRFYDPAQFSNSDFKEKLESLWSKYDDFLIKLQGSLPSSHYKDMDDKLKILRKRLSNEG